MKFSEKATKIWRNQPFLYVPKYVKRREISSNFVAFSEYMNFKRAHHINMRKEREKIKMLSVNQMSVYHTVLEAYNIAWNKSSYQLHQKFMHGGKHSERSAAKKWLVCTRKTSKKVYRFLLYWTEIIQYDTKEYKRSPDNKCLQNPAQRMDLEEHPLMTFDYYYNLTKPIPIHLYIYISYCW